MIGTLTVFTWLLSILGWVIRLYSLSLFIYFIIINWTPHVLENGFGKFIQALAKPLAHLFNVKATISGKLVDFSPLITSLLINLAWFIISSILAYLLVAILFM